MSESESAITESQEAPAATDKEDITYQAVEKDGVVTAIWEMKGRKHLRTIDPRSRQGREILNLYTTEDVEHPASSEAADATDNRAPGRTPRGRLQSMMVSYSDQARIVW